MTTTTPPFVLVPGAWLGAWAWDDVVARLRTRGADAVAVSLTGMAERPATPDTDLDTHVGDVLAILEEVPGAVLVGHSYAGAVVAAAADRAPERLAGVVYVDSAPLPDGTCVLDLYPQEVADALRAEHGDTGELPFPGWDALDAEGGARGLDATARALVTARARPQPFGTYSRPVRLTGAGDAVPRAAIACDELRQLVADGLLGFMAEPAWTYRELDTGHWPMLSAPGALGDALLDVAAELAARPVSAVSPRTPATG